MLNFNDNYTLYDQNDVFEIAVWSAIGDRKEQQDRIGYSLRADEGIAVICDGMGGHQGGQLASTLAVENFVEAYNSSAVDDPQKFFFNEVGLLDKTIAQLRNSDGSKMQAGSTLSAVMIQKHNLYWVSVGDSRIYVCRNNEFVCTTKDHTYKMILDAKRSSGTISNEKYSQEIKKGHILVSFLGVNGLPFVESNAAPLGLLNNDIILVMSDGIYKLLTDNEIFGVLQKSAGVKNILENLYLAIQKKSSEIRKNKDNISIVVIKIK